jgi:hypothetical protein
MHAEAVDDAARRDGTRIKTHAQNARADRRNMKNKYLWSAIIVLIIAWTLFSYW